MTTRTANDKTMRDYIKGLLSAEPGMTNADINYYLDKKFGRGSALTGDEILKIREEAGYTAVGKGKGRKYVPISEAKATEERPPAPPPAPVTPAQPVAAVRTPPAAQLQADREADDNRLRDLVSKIQQIMTREGIVYVEIPRHGEAKIHQTEVTTRTLAPYEATEAAHH